MSKITVEISGRVEFNTQGWGDGCTLEQIKKQAKDEIRSWKILLDKGGLQNATPLQGMKIEVTEVVIEV